jgi:hypothetical protein
MVQREAVYMRYALLSVLVICLGLGAAAPPVDRVHRVAACGGGIEIVGETKITPHRMAILSPKGTPDGAGVDWDVSPDDKAHVEQRGKELFIVAPPGKYRVTLRSITVEMGVVQIARCKVEVEFEGSTPTLPPIPIPVPPTPTPPTPAPPKDGEKANPAKALGRLRVGSAGCTATVIGPRRPDGRWDILTASHCLDSARTGTVTMQDGKVYRVTKTAQDAKADICWLVTDDVIETLPFALLAKETPKADVAVWHSGYGVDRPGNREEGTVLGVDGLQLRINLNVSSGDSGGGIFRTDTGELVACVCCTRSRAAKTTMWGGHSVRALEMRPRGDRTTLELRFDGDDGLELLQMWEAVSR